MKYFQTSQSYQTSSTFKNYHNSQTSQTIGLLRFISSLILTKLSDFSDFSDFVEFPPIGMDSCYQHFPLHIALLLAAINSFTPKCGQSNFKIFFKISITQKPNLIKIP